MNSGTMRILEGLDGLRQLSPGSVLSIGNFDGVHRGHETIIEFARELRAKSGGRLALVTFEPHPLTVLRPDKVPPRLTTPATKRALLAAMGVDDLVILPPTHDVLDISAEDFFAILRDEVRPAHMIEGDSFNFGKDRRGTIDRLREWTAQSNIAGRANIALHVIDPVSVVLLDMQIVEVNSSLIRWLLSNGRVRDAAICLGRPYTIEGKVIEGSKRGRTIGVPTANLDVADQLVPCDGVYAARCPQDHRVYPAALSIGSTPTFDGGHRQIEAHLIGFSGDLYGRTISIDIIDWLRDQRRFTNIDSLKDQLHRDIDRSNQRAKIDPSRPVAVAS